MGKESHFTSINDFKNKFTSVRPNLFRIVLPSFESFPFLKNNFIKTDKVKDIYLYCKVAALPESLLEEISVAYLGRYFYEGTDRTFNNLNLTFYNSQDFAIRNFIEFWMNHINGNVSNHQIENIQDDYNQFLDTMTIQQLDRRENVIKSYDFHGCYPIRCSEIELDYSQNNTLEEFSTVFRYQYFDTQELFK